MNFPNRTVIYFLFLIIPLLFHELFLVKNIIMKTVSMKPVVQNPRKDGFWTDT